MSAASLVVMPADDLAKLIERAVQAGVAAALATRGAPAAPDATYLSVPKFATRLGCSSRHVWNLIRRGLPTLGEGKARRIRVADADRWLEEDSVRARVPQAAAVPPDPEVASIVASAKRLPRRRVAVVGRSDGRA